MRGLWREDGFRSRMKVVWTFTSPHTSSPRLHACIFIFDSFERLSTLINLVCICPQTLRILIDFFAMMSPASSSLRSTFRSVSIDLSSMESQLIYNEAPHWFVFGLIMKHGEGLTHSVPSFRWLPRRRVQRGSSRRMISFSPSTGHSKYHRPYPTSPKKSSILRSTAGTQSIVNNLILAPIPLISMNAAPWFSMLWSKLKMSKTPLSPFVAHAEKAFVAHVPWT